MPNTPEARGQESHNAKDHISTEMGFMKRAEKNPDTQAKDRVQAVEKKLKPLTTQLVSKETKSFEQQIDDVVLNVVIPQIEEKANFLKDLVVKEAGRGIVINPVATATLKYVLKELNKDTGIRIKEKPTPQVLDALVTIGKANKDSPDPTVQAEVQALRTLVIEMQATLKKQAETPVAVAPAININIQNVNGPQAAPQLPTMPELVEVRDDPANWKEEGRKCIQNVQYLEIHINEIVKAMKQSGKENREILAATSNLRKQRNSYIDMANDMIKEVRDPNSTKVDRVLSKNETKMEMRKWVTEMDVRTTSVQNGGAELFTVPIG